KVFILPFPLESSSAANTVYEACVRNDSAALQKVLERGVTREEVMELDVNGWNGLMVACCKGFLDIVHGLHTCPFIDINHQDNEGNTALMIASQGGHIFTVMYLLNYYPGVDTEIRDCRGFTALIKAAMTGRCDVVAALVMAGADVNAVDSFRGRCARDWTLKTGRYETFHRLRRLTVRPRAEQFCESYVPEWPDLVGRVTRATSQKTSAEKITLRIKSTFGFSFPRDPQENGVMDHMVRMTTSVHSPLVVTACHPLLPTSPPEVGKRRLAVPELVKKHPQKDLGESSVCHSNGSVSYVSPSFRVLHSSPRSGLPQSTASDASTPWSQSRPGCCTSSLQPDSVRGENSQCMMFHREGHFHRNISKRSKQQRDSEAHAPALETQTPRSSFSRLF
uniref:Ankyrin repeat domain 33 n=1 Tax=Poecilia latipinna TaxID=48699 RepID=A0A3B3UIG0_9TELE